MLPGRLAADNDIQVFSMREMGVQRRGSVFEEPGRFGLRGTRQGTKFLPGTYSGGLVEGLGQRVHSSSCRSREPKADLAGQAGVLDGASWRRAFHAQGKAERQTAPFI